MSFGFYKATKFGRKVCSDLPLWIWFFDFWFFFSNSYKTRKDSPVSLFEILKLPLNRYYEFIVYIFLYLSLILLTFNLKWKISLSKKMRVICTEFWRKTFKGRGCFRVILFYFSQILMFVSLEIVGHLFLWNFFVL